MPVYPEAPIIAVFGPSSDATPEDGAIAMALGSAIAGRGWILLSGGQGDHPGQSCTAVKDCAIAGAEKVDGEYSSVRWIGVVKPDDADGPQEPRPSVSGHGLVLTPGYGHKRNFVEARLCDGAIAIAGGEGTKSEVAFCLTLGRPLLLVGPAWGELPLLSEEQRAGSLTKLNNAVKNRVKKKSPASPWDPAIDIACRQLIDADLQLPPVEYWAEMSSSDAVSAVDRVGELLERKRLSRDFPRSADSLGAATAYKEWVG